MSYVNIVQEKTPEMLDLTLTNPLMLVGLFLGAMLTFVFSALTMSAVQSAAQSIVVEVRRQFKEIAGIMEAKPTPTTPPVWISAPRALCMRWWSPPAGHCSARGHRPDPGRRGRGGPAGRRVGHRLCMAVFMSNAGGAWDNAKKYIEAGHHGGKGSPCHKAAVVGDTVGDPFKDTSGPSLNILIKLVSTVSIVFSGLVVAFHIL